MSGGITAQRKHKVLLVDDEPENLDLLRRFLRKHPVEIQSFESPLEALEAIKRTDFRLIISDQRMPHMDGVTLLEQARHLAPQAERVLVSAHADFGTLREAINRAHIEHFLPKPLLADQVSELAERLLDLRPPTRPAVLVLGSGLLTPAGAGALARAGYDVKVGNVEEPAAIDREQRFDVIALDLRTSEDEAAHQRWLTVRQRWPETALVLVTSPERVETAVGMAGFETPHDVMLVPYTPDELLLRVRRAHERQGLTREVATLRRERRGTFALAGLVGRSPAMRAVLDMVERIGPTNATVLLRGETGTGKELVAHVLHSMSRRRDRPFVAVNCAALADTLVEAELFGHEKGAFTGATARRVGRFEAAHTGTLFLDEVGDIPAPVQVKLLRVLQERVIQRVGGNDSIPVDVRLITATHGDLEAQVRQGELRADLFYRINVVPITLPPLRERREDISLLAEHFLEQMQVQSKKRGLRFSAGALRRLEDHAWPGNVRELHNVVERLVALLPDGHEIQAEDLLLRAPSPPTTPARGVAISAADRSPLVSAFEQTGLAAWAGHDAAPGTLKDILESLERRILVATLERHRGNKSRAARELGLSRQALQQKLTRFRLRAADDDDKPGDVS